MKKIIQEEISEIISDVSGVKCEDCTLTENDATLHFSFGYGCYPEHLEDGVGDGDYATFHFTREEAVRLWKIVKTEFPNLKLKNEY